MSGIGARQRGGSRTIYSERLSLHSLGVIDSIDRLKVSAENEGTESLGAQAKPCGEGQSSVGHRHFGAEISKATVT